MQIYDISIVMINSFNNPKITKCRVAKTISWFSNNVQLFPESNGSVSGILGRYSGELVLNFQSDDSHKINSLTFDCRKFTIKDRKF